jgi:type I restriction enzyme S subunit
MIFPLRPLEDLVENHDARRIPVKASDRKPGPYPYYGAQGVVDYVSDFIFDGEFVLVAEDGENLRSRNEPIALMASGKFWVNNHAHILRGNENSITRFLYYAINQADISGYVSGSTIPKLSQRSMNAILLPCPEISEQEQIVAVLGALDDKIELNRRTNETLEAMARALFKDWFVDFGPTRAKAEGRTPYLAPDLWSLFPDRLNEETGLPEGWEPTTIGDEVRVVGGSTPSTKEPEFWDGEFNWATPKDLSTLTSPVLLDTSRTITKAGLEKISSGLLPVGTVLLSSRAPIGYLAIAEVPVAINQGFIAMVCDGRISNVFAWLWTLENMGAILAKANGSTFQEISKGNFRSLPLDLPSDALRAAFDAVALPIYRRIEQNEKETRTLAQTRDLLLPKLMSGEIRLREAEKIAEAAL